MLQCLAHNTVPASAVWIVDGLNQVKTWSNMSKEHEHAQVDLCLAQKILSAKRQPWTSPATPSWAADRFFQMQLSKLTSWWPSAESLNHPSAQGPTHLSAVCHTSTATSCKVSSNTGWAHGHQLSNMDNLYLPFCGPQTCRGWVLLPPDKVLASVQPLSLLLVMCSGISMCLVSRLNSLTSRNQPGEEERNILLAF